MRLGAGISLDSTASGNLQSLLAMQKQQKDAWNDMLEKHSEEAFLRRALEQMKRAFFYTKVYAATQMADAAGELIVKQRWHLFFIAWKGFSEAAARVKHIKRCVRALEPDAPPRRCLARLTANS